MKRRRLRAASKTTAVVATSIVRTALRFRPRNCFGNCRLNESPPTLTRTVTAMHLHTFRDESRSWHLDLIGGRGHPWSIDLVVVIASGIMLIGLACAFAALLIR
jgi:hypothetical protein